MTFQFFAQLTVKHAARYARDDDDVDVVYIVRQAWQAVGIDPSDLRKSKKKPKKMWDSDCAVL